MIIMIMNLMRAKPKLFVKQIEGLRSLYEIAPGMRYIPKAVLRPMDVDQSIAFLESCHGCQGLEISPELCQISREQTLVIPQSRIGGGDLSTIYNSGQMRKVGPSGGRRKSQNPSRQEQRSHSRQGSSESRLKQLLGTSGAQKNVQNDLDESFETIKQSSGYVNNNKAHCIIDLKNVKATQNLKKSSQKSFARYTQKYKSMRVDQSQKPIAPGFTGVKSFILDLQSRQDLTVTTFKEFFEAFMTSVRHDHIFHKDLMDPSFTYLGISLTFEDGNIMMSSGMNRHSSQFGTVSISCPAKLSIIMAQRKQADNLAYRNESQD